MLLLLSQTFFYQLSRVICELYIIISAATLIDGTPLTPQQLGLMGMEALETVVGYWEDALAAYQPRNGMYFQPMKEFYNTIKKKTFLALILDHQNYLTFRLGHFHWSLPLQEFSVICPKINFYQEI